MGRGQLCLLGLPAVIQWPSLSRIWKDKHLTTATKVRLYQALVMSVILYAAETWTLLAADLKSLEAFHYHEMSATDLRYSLD